MMRPMSRGNESHGPDGKLIVTGNSASHPRIVRHIPEQRNAGSADVPEFLDMRRPGNSIGGSSGRGNILIITRQRCIESSSEP